MASILKIKRSSTNPTATPAGLGQGELAYGEGTSTYTDAQGANVTSFGKLFVGRGPETAGVSANIDIIGGKYFTDLLDHGHGTIVSNSAAIVDSSKKVNEWNVDNITLDGNTISTTNSNGNLTIDTNGTGDVVISGSSTLGDNLFKINDGSVDRFIVDSFSGAVDITSPTLSASDTLLNISSTWNNGGSTFYGIDLDVINTASAASSRLLNLSVGGSDKFNVDVSGNVYLTGNISYATAVNSSIQDNTAGAFVVKEGSNKYIDIDTTNNAELLTLGNSLATVNIVIEDNTPTAFAIKEGSQNYVEVDTNNAQQKITIGNDNTRLDNKIISGSDAFIVREGSNKYIDIDTGVGSELITFSTGNVDIDNDLNIDGGDLTTNQSTFNLLNTNATTVNFAGSATTVEIGSATGTTNVNNNLVVDLDLQVKGGDLTTNQSTFNLLNTNATTVNFAGSATTVEIGSATGTTNVNNNLVVDLDLQVKGGDLTTNQSTFNLLNTNATTVNFAGSATTVEIGSATGTTNVNNNLDVDGDLNIDGGDLTVSNITFNLANANATTVNAFGAATAIEIGAASGTTNINNNLDVDGDVNIDGGALTVSTATFNLANANATTVNFAGSATTVEIGSASGTTNINNNLDVDGDVNIDGGDLTVSTATFNLVNTTATTVNAFGAAGTINFGSAGSGTTRFRNNTLVGTESTQYLFDTVATTVNFAGAATTVEIGAASGTTNINNNLEVDLDLQVNGGDLTTNQSTFNLLNTTATTVNFAGAATTVEIGAASGTTNINNDLDVDGDVNIDGGDLTVSTATFNLVNTNATTVNFAGAATTLNIGSSSTEVDFGDLRIVGSTIYSDNSGAQTITIDPYPAGGDGAGNVVVRGNLQVSGTTTTVNSTQMTVNDPIFTLGDSISEKTVVSAAASGQSVVILDDVDGLNVGDIVSGNASIPNGTTITNINVGANTITLSANLSAGIAASTNTSPKILTFTQGADDNKDRGIEFKYFNSGLKTGFFGYDESGTSEGATTTYYFTYIPDATNTSQVFTGTVGSAYFNTTKLDIGIHKGVPYFDQYKRLTSTDAAGTADITTSNQILTVTAAGVPVWTTTIDGGTY